jgi:hypothetical protein
MFKGTAAPGFAAIITLRSAAGIVGAKPDFAALEATLGALPVTAADQRARCARYDEDAPPARLPPGRQRILLFEKMTGYRDGPSVEAAQKAFREMAARNGWSLTITDRGGAMTPRSLARFDAVVWNNVSGDVLTVAQRRAFRSYIERGGGFVGMHGSSGDPVSFWDWYRDVLIGARFVGHPMAPQF